jgi:protein-disulfide isomerase
MTKRSNKKSGQSSNTVFIGGAVLVLLFLALLAWRGVTNRPSVERTPNLIGNLDAPVQIIEYADFGCTACKGLHESGTIEQLVEQFGDDISIEYRHFPVITAQSPKAAEASQCAAEQDAFWVYHDYLFEEASQGLGVPALKEYATAVNLDSATFDQCLDSGKYTDVVEMDEMAALTAGARGTPTVLVNGQRVTATYENIAGAIHNALDG